MNAKDLTVDTSAIISVISNEKTKSDIASFAKDFISFKKEIKDVPGLKSFFKLNPPVKGFERKGIKVPFAQGGVVGYRKDKIKDILTRML